MSTELALGFINAVKSQRDTAGAAQSFDTTALAGLTDCAAAPGRFTAALPITPAVQNRYGTLHGGCIGGLPGARGEGRGGADSAACTRQLGR